MNETSNTQAEAELRLWQLISPTLPVGAYAYSQGLEYAVHLGWVADEDSAHDWISGLAGEILNRLDIPVIKRLHQAWQAQDIAAVQDWNRFLLSSRESQELLEEDQQLGQALARLLQDLDLTDIQQLDMMQLAYATPFCLAAARWHIPAQRAALGYLWSWCENQVAAAIKLIPLGQTAGQRILSHLAANLPQYVQQGWQLEDQDIGASAYGLAIASAFHETQYTRLFRS